MFNKILKKNIDAIVLFVFCIILFFYIINNVESDIPTHLNYIKDLNAGTQSYSSNFGFYLLVNLLSGFSSQVDILNTVTTIVLSVATTAKYLISKEIIIKLNLKISKQYTYQYFMLIGLSLFFCFAIIDPFIIEQIYLGRIVPVVWHNSTTILLFPFAVLLFWKQYQVLESLDAPKMKDAAIIGLLLFLNLIIKPSFVFAYAPVTILFLWPKLKSTSIKNAFVYLMPLMISALIIIIQYYIIYQLSLGSFQKEQSGVGFCSPFELYYMCLPKWYLPIMMLLSFALPIFSMIAYPAIRRYKVFRYALCMLIVGVLISAFVVETGPRFAHGNFTWQNVICSYLLFLSTISFLTPKILDRKSWTKKEYIMLFLLLLHVLSGMFYIKHILVILHYI
jgi:hypothetical protein